MSATTQSYPEDGTKLSFDANRRLSGLATADSLYSMPDTLKDGKPIDIIDSEEPDNEVDELESTNPGYKEWKRRRKEWTKSNLSSSQKSKLINESKSLLNNVPESAYPSIYKMLVKENKPLKKPINLGDALKVIKAGWIADGTWPSEEQLKANNL
jgi:hypothetical protein